MIAKKEMIMRHLLRALRSRNYRLFVAGQSVSLVGTWMQQVAMSWLVYRLTGSVMLLGVVGFTSQIPIIILSPIAGVLADRWERRRLLIILQSLAMFQAVLLALVVLSGIVQIWHIILLSLFMGVVNAFDVPIRHSFVVEMVEHQEDLGNAIALNSSMVNSAHLLGPSIAGLLVAFVGEGICFMLNAVSYLAVITAFTSMRIPHRSHPVRPRRHVMHELHEGFMYAYKSGPIRSILLLVAFVSLMVLPYTVLVPVIAKDILHGGAHTFGFLMTASGGGALIGTLYLATRRSVLGLDRVIVTATLILAIGVGSFAFSGNFIVSLAALVLTGFGVMTLLASCNTILQTILEEDKRGRVMGLLTMAYMGMVPIGSLGTGAIAVIIGPRDTLLIGCGCSLIAAVVFVRQLPRIRKEMRPDYIRMGIIREAAD